MLAVASSATAFVDHVRHVLLSRSNEQMVRVHAHAGVAGVANIQPGRHGAYEQFVADSVSTDLLTVYRRVAVSIALGRS